MAQQVGSLSVELSASVAAFRRDLGKAVDAVDSSQAKMNRALASMEKGFNSVASSMGKMAMRGALAFVGLNSITSAASNVVRTMFDLEGASSRAGKAVDKDLVAAIERAKRSAQGATLAIATMLGKILTYDATELKARIADLEDFQRMGLEAPGVPDIGAEIARLKAQLAEQEQIKAEKSLDERLDAEQSVRDAIERENKLLEDRAEAQAENEKQLQDALNEESAARSLLFQDQLEAKQKLYESFDDATFERMGEAIKRQKTAVEDFQDAVDSLTDSWADGLTRVLLRMDSMKDVMRALIMQMASNAMTSFVTGPIMSALGSAIFGGARAGGGPITAGSTYLVGENGPELMTAGASGSITPLQGSRGGQSKTVIGAINVGQGASVAAVAALQRVLAQVNASIEPRAVAANNAARRRGVSK